jgi:hypothetical protein
MASPLIKLLSQEAKLERQLALVREKIKEKWVRLENRTSPGFGNVMDAEEIREVKSKGKGNDRKSDMHFELEMARRLEQDRSLSSWRVASMVAARRPNSSLWNAAWTLIDVQPYHNALAKRIYRKFQTESGKRFRCMYLICVASPENRGKVSEIVATHQQRIGQSSILEKDISDDYLEELRSAVAEDVRRDREGMSCT